MKAYGRFSKRGKKKGSLPSVVDAVEFRREQYGLNQKEMAAALGWTEPHYSEFVHGKREMPKSVMGAAFRIGVPATCLFQTKVEPLNAFGGEDKPSV